MHNRPSGRHSELHAWMVENYSALSGEPLNWVWMMRQIRDRELTNRMGKTPPLATAKRTWFRVVAIMRSRPAPVEKLDIQRKPTIAPQIQHPTESRFGFASIKTRE